MLEEIRVRWIAGGGEHRNREALSTALGVIKRVIREIEEQTDAPATRMANHVNADGDVPYMEARMGLSHDGGAPRLRNYRVELRGAGEFVVLIDGEDAWRGTDVEDPQMAELLATAMMAPLLEG